MDIYQSKMMTVTSAVNTIKDFLATGNSTTDLEDLLAVLEEFNCIVCFTIWLPVNLYLLAVVLRTNDFWEAAAANIFCLFLISVNFIAIFNSLITIEIVQPSSSSKSK